MTHEQLRALCIATGMKRLVAMSSPDCDLVLGVAPDVDLDGEFRAVCLYTGELLTVRGWDMALHDDAEGRAAVAAEFWDWREA